MQISPLFLLYLDKNENCFYYFSHSQKVKAKSAKKSVYGH